MAANNNKGTPTYHTWTSLIQHEEELIFVITDDTVALTQVETRSKVQQKLELFIIKIKQWLESKMWLVNVNKIVCITFGNYIGGIADRDSTFKMV